MDINKELTYQLIELLRIDSKKYKGDLRSLLRSTANILESTLRAYLDLKDSFRQAVQADAKQTTGARQCACGNPDCFDCDEQSKGPWPE
jgi:hypothetical protein